MGPGVAIILYGYYLDDTLSQFDGGRLLGLHAWILQLERQETSRMLRDRQTH